MSELITMSSSMQIELPPVKEKAVRVKRKTDPALAAAARELRDRWLEAVNGQSGSPTDAPAIGHTGGKYEVSRRLAVGADAASQPSLMPGASRQMLPAA